MPQVWTTGTTARLETVQSRADGTMEIEVIGERRFEVEYVDWSGDYAVATISDIADMEVATSETAALLAETGAMFNRFVGGVAALYDRRFSTWIEPDDASSAVYDLASRLPLHTWERQAILDDRDTASQVREINRLVRRELALLKAGTGGGSSTTRAASSRATDRLAPCLTTGRSAARDNRQPDASRSRQERVPPRPRRTPTMNRSRDPPTGRRVPAVSAERRTVSLATKDVGGGAAFGGRHRARSTDPAGAAATNGGSSCAPAHKPGRRIRDRADDGSGWSCPRRMGRPQRFAGSRPMVVRNALAGAPPSPPHRLSPAPSGAGVVSGSRL